MLKFLTKVFLFVFLAAIISILALLLYKVLFNNLNKKHPDSETLFIWGDSQAKAGFHLSYLKDTLNYQVFSAAYGGQGVYDFLVFAETVPENTHIVLSISQLAQLRDKDKNRSGIPLSFLFKMISVGYYDFIPVMKKNLMPESLFYSSSSLYPYKDSLTFHEPIEKFITIYNQDNHAVDKKNKLYMAGLKKLKSKNCSIVFVEFPFHPMLSPVLSENKSKETIDKFWLDVSDMLGGIIYDTIYVYSEKRLMYDLTHMNEIGAELFTKEIFNNKDYSRDQNYYFILNDGFVE